MLCSVSHDNIIRLLGICINQEESVLLYEYEPGSALAHHLESRDLAEQLSWTSRLEIVKGLLAAVYYLHYHDPTAPCYHRDIKPSKIVVTSSGKAKLMDCPG